MGEVKVFGSVTGDNTHVSPAQLLDMVRADLGPDGKRGPVTGMVVLTIRDDRKGPMRIDTYRANLTRVTELAVMGRAWFAAHARDYGE